MKKNLILLILFILFFNFTNTNAQEGKNLKLFGNIDPVNNHQFDYYSAVWGYEANGREYGILCGTFGTYFIDVTDSANFSVRGYVPSTYTVNREAKTYSHYAYVVSESPSSALQIVDLLNLPSSVNYLGTYTVLNHSTTHSISQSGPYLYLNGANPELSEGIAVLDLTNNPEQPLLRGKWSSMYVHDSRIINDTIWACNIQNGKISVINAVNKDNLTNISQWNNLPNPNPHNCALSADRKFIFTTDETSSPPGKIKVWDIHDLTNITLVNILNPPQIFSNCIVHNVEVYGNLLIAAYYEAGIRMYDISNPQTPQELGWYDTYPNGNNTSYSGCWGVYRFNSGKIIASDRTRGLFSVKYYPPQNAKPKANFMLSKTPAYTGDSVQLIDCSDNNATTFNWSVTGPLNFNSQLPDPKFYFNAIGYYTVKLVAGNSFGTDSVTKINYLKINGSILSPFNISGPVSQTIQTNNTDTSRVNFKWGNSSRNGINITYKLRFRKTGTVNDYFILSDNNGNDTSLNVRRSLLDSIARIAGLSGDSVIMNCKAAAYNGIDSLYSTNSILVILKSSIVGIINSSTEIPGDYFIGNNYPNPFNPVTSIDFTIPQKTDVEIIIYDINGKEISKTSLKLQPGYYKYQFNGSNQTSGIYFLKISSGKFSAVRKMMLVK